MTRAHSILSQRLRPPVGLARVAPGLAVLRRYQRGWLRADVLAGITVTAYLVPQAMAYAVVAGLPPIVGLWAVVAPMVGYAFLGSSRQLSVGPESTTALLTATAVAPLAAGDPGRYAALAALLALLVGLLCAVAWLLRMGFLANLLSKPVLVGYLAGVAVLMIVSQLGTVTGIPIDADSPLARLRELVTGLGQADPATCAIAAGVLGFLLLVSGRYPRAPAPLLGMLLAVAAVAILGLADEIEVVGAIPEGLPGLQWPNVSQSDVTALLLPAAGVTIIGYTDNILTARSFAARERQDIDANAELLALGAANVSTGLLQGFPVSSSGSRTVIAHTMQAKTQVYSLVVAALVVVVLLVGGSLLSNFPTAALGAIVIYAALRLIQWAELRRFAQFRRTELALALATTAGVLLFDILYGVLLAVGLSIADLLSRMARPHDGILGFVPGLPGMHDVDDFPQARRLPGLTVYRYDSPLLFANADDFKRRATAALDLDGQPPAWLLLNMEAIVEVDITGLDALDAVRRACDDRGIVLALARTKQDLLEQLERGRFLANVDPQRLYDTLPTAVRAYLEWYETTHGHPMRGVSLPSPSVNPVFEASGQDDGSAGSASPSQG